MPEITTTNSADTLPGRRSELMADSVTFVADHFWGKSLDSLAFSAEEYAAVSARIAEIAAHPRSLARLAKRLDAIREDYCATWFELLHDPCVQQSEKIMQWEVREVLIQLDATLGLVRALADQ